MLSKAVATAPGCTGTAAASLLVPAFSGQRHQLIGSLHAAARPGLPATALRVMPAAPCTPSARWGVRMSVAQQSPDQDVERKQASESKGQGSDIGSRQSDGNTGRQLPPSHSHSRSRAGQQGVQANAAEVEDLVTLLKPIYAVVLVSPFLLLPRMDMFKSILDQASATLLFTAAALKGSLAATDYAAATLLQQLLVFGATTSSLGYLLIGILGAPLDVAMPLDFRRPLDVLWRAVNCAVMATCAAHLVHQGLDYLGWSNDPDLSHILTPPLAHYMETVVHSGDPFAIGAYAAAALLLEPFSQELLYRSFAVRILAGSACNEIFVKYWILFVSNTCASAYLHCGLHDPLSLFIASVGFAASYLASGGNLVVPILAHALFNLYPMAEVALQK